MKLPVVSDTAGFYYLQTVTLQELSLILSLVIVIVYTFLNGRGKMCTDKKIKKKEIWR